MRCSSSPAKNRSPELKVVLLLTPDTITGEFVRNLDGAHGLLSLALETNADGKIAGVPSSQMRSRTSPSFLATGISPAFISAPATVFISTSGVRAWNNGSPNSTNFTASSTRK